MLPYFFLQNNENYHVTCPQGRDINPTKNMSSFKRAIDGFWNIALQILGKVTPPDNRLTI